VGPDVVEVQPDGLRLVMSVQEPTEAARERFDAAVARLPPGMRTRVSWVFAQWPGRVLVGIAAKSIRIELFDRSMTIAAQFFTSVFPILIILGSWVGWDDNTFTDVLPDELQEVLDGAIGNQSESATFGIIGALIVLGSATSLSRALTRAFAATWDLPRPHIRLTSAWRWVAVVLALALALVMTRTLSQFIRDLTPPTLWEIVAAVTLDVLLAVFVPWMLLSGQVPVRCLLPGAVFFGLLMLVVRPAAGAWLPRALEVSADRYGAIGVAFTYLAWLYVLSFCFLAASVVGQVIATDPGRLGGLVRGNGPATRPAPSR
jgi:membrane protein